MKLSIERRKPYNFSIAIAVGSIGIAFSFISCMMGIYSIFDTSYIFQHYSFTVILLNLFVLGCAVFLIYNYKRFKLISGACLIVLALVLICFFENYYSGLVILLSGFFGVMESMLKKNNSTKGYSYFSRQNTIYESRKLFSLFMPEI